MIQLKGMTAGARTAWRAAAISRGGTRTTTTVALTTTLGAVCPTGASRTSTFLSPITAIPLSWTSTPSGT